MATPTVKDRIELFGKALQEIRTSYANDEMIQFLVFAAGLVHESKGQVFQDLWALWEARNKSEGYFVEFGAVNGISHSNTLFLEKQKNWSGICAEPMPRHHKALAQNRSCYISHKCVYVKTGESIPFLVMNTGIGALSRIASIVPDDGHERAGARQDSTEIMVETITLGDLLAEAKAPRDIDYISVDTEGSEYEILEVFDFDRWNVRAFGVEHNFDKERRERIHALMTRHGYVRKWPELSRLDDWYVRA